MDYSAMAARVNEAIARNLSGGFVVVGTDGSGGHWYSQGSRPELREDERSLDLPHDEIDADWVREQLEWAEHERLAPEVTHHCDECDEQVEEFCEAHPKARVSSVLA